jgi:hypothetical protein
MLSLAHVLQGSSYFKQVCGNIVLDEQQVEILHGLNKAMMRVCSTTLTTPSPVNMSCACLS